MNAMSHDVPNMIGARSGAFGAIEMGGMFTVLKVREGITTYEDPGWHAQPEGTAARKVPG
jgi:manganese oxidase